MGIKREFTSGAEFLNNVNEKFGTTLNANATPSMLLSAFKVGNESASYKKTDDNVLEIVNAEPEEDLPILEGLNYTVISNNLEKQNYMVGEYLDPTGLVVMGQFNDGTSRELIPNKEYKIKDYSMTDLVKLEEYQITYLTQNYITIRARRNNTGVEYDDYADNRIFVNITDENGDAFVNQFYITRKPAKTQYVVGDTIDLSNIEAYVHLSNNSGEYLNYSSLNTDLLYEDPGTLNTVGDGLVLPLTLGSRFNDPLNLAIAVVYNVTEQAVTPEINYFQMVQRPYKVVLEPNVPYDHTTDLAGAVIYKWLTDGTHESISLSDSNIRCQLDGMAFSDGSTIQVGIEYMYDSVTYPAGSYNAIIVSDPIVANLAATLNDEVRAGDTVTIDYFDIEVTYSSTSKPWMRVSSLADPTSCNLTITNPVTLGTNNYSIVYTYNGVETPVIGNINVIE